MLRRKPTKIELKLDDKEEYEAVMREKQRQAELTAAQETTISPQLEGSDLTPRTKRDVIHKRIGYEPNPLPQPSRLQIR